MDNLRIFKQYAAVPPEAQKRISGGRLNGMTDISPVWRIRCLTELFGPEGTGWVAPMTDMQFVPGTDGEVSCIVQCALRYCEDGKWSEPVHGIGGSMYVAKERQGLRTDDEAPKKAYTDALSVACKGLGIGADVYWPRGATKYEREEPPQEVTCDDCGKVIEGTQTPQGYWDAATVAQYAQKRFRRTLCPDCQKIALARIQRVKAAKSEMAEEAAKAEAAEEAEPHAD